MLFIYFPNILKMWGSRFSLFVTFAIICVKGARSSTDNEEGTPWGSAAFHFLTNNSIAHLVRQPERPTPKSSRPIYVSFNYAQTIYVEMYLINTIVMPCGTSHELLGDEEVLVESVNFSKKQFYPNSHICEWNFMVTLLNCFHKIS